MYKYPLAVQCTFMIKYTHPKERKEIRMAGVHDTDKHQISVKFHHRIWRQIEKGAEDRHMTPGEYIRWVVSQNVESVTLSAADAQIIANRIAEAEAKGKMV